MSGEPASNCIAIADPQNRAPVTLGDVRARSAARKIHGIQLAPASWIHMFPSERNGPDPIQQAAAMKPPGLESPRRRARR